MRQSFPLVIKEYTFNRISLLVDGVNGQLSDIDFYDGVRGSIIRSPSLSYDVTSSSYFRKNPYLKQTLKSLSDLSKGYLQVLETLLESLEMKYNRSGNLLPMLEVMKNALFGRL